MAYPKRENKLPGENACSFFLKADSRTFREMFDNAGDAMLVKCGVEAVHCYVNRSACKMTGYTLSELMNMGFKDLLHPEERGKIEERWEKQRNGLDLHCRYNTRIVQKNGEAIPVEVAVTVCNQKKNDFHLAVLRDIRKEKQLENERNKSQQILKGEMMKHRSEWETLNRELLQTHQAMSVLAKNIDSKKDELEQRVNTTITSKVMPIINELLADKRIERFWPEISSMAEYLNSITTKSNLHHNIISMLTDTEMKIAALVKNGMTSKNITRLMFISLETVKAHRRSIRKKLKIQNTNRKLSEYLAMVMGKETVK